MGVKYQDFDALEEVEFRTEKRWVPLYIADMLRGIETYRYTYEEAMGLANRKLLGDHIDAAVRDALDTRPF